MMLSVRHCQGALPEQQQCCCGGFRDGWQFHQKRHPFVQLVGCYGAIKIFFQNFNHIYLIKIKMLGAIAKTSVKKS